MSDIKQFFLFSGLTDNAKDDIVRSLNDTDVYKKGSTIYSSVNFSKAIGYIIKGSAYAVTNNNNHVLMRRFSEGMCFGVAALFGSDENYISTIVAETDIEILFITEKQIEEIILKYPETSVNYIKFLSDRIRFLNSKLSVISCASAEDTVYNYLISVADASDYAQLPKSMTLLSKMLGLGRASLYRSLENLENDGKIIRENNKIKVIRNEKIS